MQCRGLTEERRRCTNEASASAYCAAHQDELLRWAKDGAPAQRSGFLARLRGNGSVRDGGKYNVPKWLYDAPTPQVIKHLRSHPDSMARWMAAFVLRKRRAVEAVEPLWDALRFDEIRFVRQQSAVALGKIGAPVVFAPLIEAMHHDRDPGVREACVIALGNLGNPAASEDIVRILEREENVFVKWDCITALGQLGDRRAEKLLARLQVEEIAQVIRDACRDALSEIRQRDRAAA